MRCSMTLMGSRLLRLEEAEADLGDRADRAEVEPASLRGLAGELLERVRRRVLRLDDQALEEQVAFETFEAREVEGVGDRGWSRVSADTSLVRASREVAGLRPRGSGVAADLVGDGVAVAPGVGLGHRGGEIIGRDLAPSGAPKNRWSRSSKARSRASARSTAQARAGRRGREPKARRSARKLGLPVSRP